MARGATQKRTSGSSRSESEKPSIVVIVGRIGLELTGPMLADGVSGWRLAGLMQADWVADWRIAVPMLADVDAGWGLAGTGVSKPVPSSGYHSLSHGLDPTRWRNRFLIVMFCWLYSKSHFT